MKIAGIDEAGKGPVVGPMIIAGVMIPETRVTLLEQLSLRDSKALSPKRREFLAGGIKKVAKYHILEVSARQIDALRERMTMNEIMVVSYAKVLKELKPDRVFVDAADVDPRRFAQNVRKKYGASIDIISEHNADVKYPIVSAASILAKVRRDAAMRDLEKRIGQEMGSGYPSDPRTMHFLENWVQKHGSLPIFVRHSWKTAQAVLKKHGQSSLSKF
ncbi:MAG: ribonuclease HII [Methanocellales archaeon]|nr:ribonuclease HII [Methanocellales archaeon]